MLLTQEHKDALEDIWLEQDERYGWSKPVIREYPQFKGRPGFEQLTDPNRLFQRDLYAEADEWLKKRQRVVVQSATGSGKTYLGTAYAADWPGRVLVLVHRQELVDQWLQHKKMLGATRMMVRTIQQHMHPKFIEMVNWNARDLLIVDEMHHYVDNEWEKAVTDWKGRVLGLTATPARANPYRGFDHLWDHLIIGPSKKDLIAIKAMTRALVKDPKFGYVEGRGSSEDGDFSMTATMQLFAKSVLQQAAMVDYAVDWWQEEAPGTRTIIFACNAKHAEALQKYCEQVGLVTAIITAKTPRAERRRHYSKFRHNELDALITIAVLTEGVDLPMCETVLIPRPTKSLVLWLQMVGRCLRAYENIFGEEKEYGLVLDAAGNHTRLGHPDDDHFWTLAPREWDKRDPKVCEYCNTVNLPDRTECIECGMPLPMGSRIPAKMVSCSICGRRRSQKIQQCPFCLQDVDVEADPADHPNAFGHRNVVFLKDHVQDDVLVRYFSELPAFKGKAWLEQKEEFGIWYGGIELEDESEVPAVTDVRKNQVVFKKNSHEQPYKVVDLVINKIKSIDREL